MTFFFSALSYYLRHYPLASNVCLSTTVGFCGDVVCQTIYEPLTGSRPPLRREDLPPESRNSRWLMELESPYLRRAKQQAIAEDLSRARDRTNTQTHQPLSHSHWDDNNTIILVDFRRSFIFCSFTFFFGVPYFLWVYKHLDRWIDPSTITKRNAILKGAMSFIAAQVTNPLYLSYVTALDHFFIHRDGRDGRRRVMEVARGGSFSTHCLTTSTEKRMGNYYRFVPSKAFNVHEYINCVRSDATKKITHDFPDIVRYGFIFWGINWLPMFYYIPSHFRLAYSSFLQVAWSGIMSYLVHRGEPPRGPRKDVWESVY